MSENRPTVVPLTPTRPSDNAELVAELEELLEQAREGKIQSLIIGVIPSPSPYEHMMIARGWNQRNYLMGLGLLYSMTDFYRRINPAYFEYIDNDDPPPP